MDLHNIRETYKFDSLLESKLEQDPIVQFTSWFEAYSALGVKDSNAMAIATVDAQGIPNNRIVLLKSVEAGKLIFFTNYGSKKGQDLSKNPNISALFFWREQERQVRVEGTVTKISLAKSEAYFSTRPYLSKIGAAASEQSQPIDNREALEEKFRSFQDLHPEGGEVPMPGNWGGYEITPIKFEFWQGREGRLHDRIIYEREGEDWRTTRLQP